MEQRNQFVHKILITSVLHPKGRAKAATNLNDNGMKYGPFKRIAMAVEHRNWLILWFWNVVSENRSGLRLRDRAERAGQFFWRGSSPHISQAGVDRGLNFR
jgi:hypothetical protein